MAMTVRHLRTLDDLSREDVNEIFERTAELKQRLGAGERPARLAGRMVVQLFEKPSLRTRVSFEAAMGQLGGSATFLSSKEAGLNGREALSDIARVLSSYADAVILRTYSQQLIDGFAVHSRCPVINALSDERHPCQALTDLFTLREVFGELTGRRLAYIGDGNNVARSLCVGAALVGMPLTVCAPPEYALNEEFLNALRVRVSTADITTTHDPAAAVKTADVVYTDVWASMGQESEAAARNTVFAPYQVNGALMAQAPAGCKFMHDMPARRGLEVTDEVMDGPNSIVFQQAENRLHLAKGLLVWLLGG